MNVDSTTTFERMLTSRQLLAGTGADLAAGTRLCSANVDSRTFFWQSNVEIETTFG